MILAVAILALILVTALTSVSSDSQEFQSVAHSPQRDGKAYPVLEVIRQKLSSAQGKLPAATLTADLGASGTAFVAVTSTLGFPDRGLLLIDRGTGSEERVAYASFDPVANTFTGLTRGLQCSTASPHLAGSTITWAGLAQPIENQVNPALDQFDGQTQEFSGNSFFNGDGTGFSFRVPSDPAADTRDVWSALYFSVSSTVTEAALGGDMNHDGDQLDVFNLGSIKLRSWNTLDQDSAVEDIRLSPPAILQEQCNWGGDLNSDGFDDPLFLWDPTQRRLHVRLFVLGGATYSGPTVKDVDSVVFLPDPPQSEFDSQQ